MRYLGDPIQKTRTLLRLAWGLGAVCVFVCGVWALAPVKDAQRPAPLPQLALARPTASQEARPAVNREAFAARIWNPPPDARVPAAPQVVVAEEARALKLELIAIIDEGDGLLRAVLYDAETDRLHIVGSGDRIRGHTVTNVAAKAVDLSDGASATRLALREGTS